MNLIEDQWMPVRRKDGSRDWIAPDRLSNPDIVVFDADRADFNGALMQFAIGLLQTTAAVESSTTWRQHLASPPDAQTLRDWFAPVAEAFNLDGDGPRFMQDAALATETSALNPVSALLIESPGENALRNNSDHFIKRGRLDALCPACAATALFTLQTNAPAGGVGYRTGLRGGGPVTTLLLHQSPTSLWQDVWLNVVERPRHLERCGDSGRSGAWFRFPWLTDVASLQPGGELAPAQVHPDHIFWATPRRIRLDLNNVGEGSCGLCGRTSDKLIRHFAAKNYGLNYKGPWDHPLSPYYKDKTSGLWSARHPSPGGATYRHWLAWVLGQIDAKNMERPARVVTYALESRLRQLGGALRLWAFGYDMDNMKARCWYESSLPLYGLGECESKAALQAVSATVTTWLAGAQQAVFFLRSAVKDAWFGGDARGDFSAIDAEFWQRTEAAFYGQLRQCIETLRSDEHADPDSLESRQAWHHTLRTTALALFDNTFVGAGPIERQKPRRVAQAHRQLMNNLNGKKMREVLRLPAAEKLAGGRDKATTAEV
ncbi:MAG TPA: type I-E CRISPR-associated protein Cse1/CasA [Thauera aminoaromatica]|nr:type I-E CRISPR-associated protein Cse1/CasA [Thauera aminoaromatica]